MASADVVNMGSTVLHLDVASAVNLLVYDTQAGTSGADSGAHWLIFQRADTQAIRQYWHAKHPNYQGDIIHAQELFVNEAILDELWSDYGVKPYSFVQKQGQAVFVPAGCAHQVGACTHAVIPSNCLIIAQVSNRSACIKIAMDFMDVSSIEACWKITEEFHAQKRQDTLQIRSTLWYSWKSITTQLKALVSNPSQNGSTQISRKRHHNFLRKHAISTEIRTDARKRMRLSGSGDADNYGDIFKFSCPHSVCNGIRRYNETGFKQHV